MKRSKARRCNIKLTEPKITGTPRSLKDAAAGCEKWNRRPSVSSRTLGTEGGGTEEELT